MKTMAEHWNDLAVDHDDNFLNRIKMAEFYDEVERQIDKCDTKTDILVLGCGTGLEIERIRHRASVHAVDISEGMLAELNKKRLHPEITLTTQCGSFLEMDFPAGAYDIVLSCHALHHFNEAQKLALYGKIHASLRPGGVFVNGDITEKDAAGEAAAFDRAEAIYREQNQPFGSLHIDVPFCVEHEIQVLRAAGFGGVSVKKEWERAKLMRAVK